ncbi:MAG: hypothetical protein ABI760_06025 [Ferruginibacter sp.]
MKKVNHLYYLLLFTLLSVITACQKEKQEQIPVNEEILSVSENVLVPETENLSVASRRKFTPCNTFYGPAVKMGNGYIRSWINISKGDNKPWGIGIEFTCNSFRNLPTDPLNFEANTFILKLHHKAIATTPFNHITINWEPEGHEPPGIYDVPHFDTHFYKISVENQNLITGVPGPVPSPGYLPASYVIQGGTVPQMGTHWLDPSSPELPPTSAPFTHTFIYGSNQGDVHFLEPMITRAYFLAGKSVSKPFPQPIHFSPSQTNYPTVYKIWKNSENGRSYVALTDFVFR